MRIAFVLGSTPPRHDRADDLQDLVENHGDWLGDEAQAVAALGHDVSIHLMYSRAGAASHQGVDWFFHRPLIGFSRLRGGKEYCPALKRSLRTWAPDLIHYQIISHAMNYAYCARTARTLSVPLVGQHHGDPISPFFWNNAALRGAARRSAAVVFLTRFHRDLYCERLGIERAKTEVIPVGYNDYFQRRDQAACRAKTGLEGDPVFFWAAMLNKRKDPLLLLRAFRAVSERFPEARLYMAGSGPIEEEVKHLLSADVTLSRSVTLLGYVDNRDLPDYLNAADVYVMASHWEGFAISSMEAMACGAFPVLTRIPCFVEQTDNGKLGLLFEPGDQNDLEDKLMRVAGDRQWRDTVRRALRAHIAPFTWRASAQKLDRLYSSLLSGR